MGLKSSLALFLIVASLLCFTTGCRKKVTVREPTPPVSEVVPPTPPLPTASISVEPATVESGQAVTLQWASTDATEVTISGLGTVPAEGKRELRPDESTTYALVAKGPGGSAEVAATVTVVSLPPAPPAPPFVEAKSLAERLDAEVSDVYFDYDQSGLREDARASLARDAMALRSILADFPDAVIVMEGHCDERGSAEYNIALGDRRAVSASVYLEELGLTGERLQRISYGKEKPQCTEETEACWQKNRRVHFAAGATSTN